MSENKRPAKVALHICDCPMSEDQTFKWDEANGMYVCTVCGGYNPDDIYDDDDDYDDYDDDDYDPNRCPDCGNDTMVDGDYIYCQDVVGCGWSEYLGDDEEELEIE